MDQNISKIVFIVAMIEELEKIFFNFNIESIESKVFPIFKIHNQIYNNKLSVYCYVSGIGSSNSSSCAQYVIDKEKDSAQLFINIGTAGGLNKKYNSIGEIVRIEKAYQSSVDLTGFGYKLGQLPKRNTNYYELANFKKINSLNVKAVNCSTSDIFINNEELASNIYQKFGTTVFDMEIGFITHVFERNGLKDKLLSFKGITDIISDKKNEEDFIKNFDLATKNLNNFVLKLLN